MHETEILKPISQYGVKDTHAPLMLAIQDKFAGRISQAELSSLCYLWAYCYVLHEYGYKPLPIVPNFMVEFYRLKEETQHRLLEKNDDKAEQVRSYLRNVYRIQAENRVNKEWLEEMLEYFEGLNQRDKVQKIKEVKNGHP